MPRRSKRSRRGRANQLRTVLRDIGVIAHVPGAMALASLPVCLLFDEIAALPAFLWTGAVSFGLGQALYWRFRRAGRMQVRHAMATAVAGWIVVPLIGMIPFVAISESMQATGQATATLLLLGNPLNALFESVSGFTGTGLTVTLRPSELPHVLQWWRSFSEWVGGVGVIVLVLAVFHPSAESGRLLYSEARDEHIRPRLIGTIRTIWWLYLSWTLIGILALGAAGMPWWDAVNHGLTGISTGGFSVSDDSLAGYSRAAQGIMMILMIAGSVSFAVQYRVVARRQPLQLWHDKEHRALFLLLLLGAAAVVGENLVFGHAAGVFDSIFLWVSALCTAGFQTDTVGDWSPTAILILVCGMMIGGASGATTGGLKQRRAMVLADAARVRIVRMSRQPWRLMERKPIASETDRHAHGPLVEACVVLLMLWVGGVTAGAIVMTHAAGESTPLITAAFESASALGNVGLSAGLTQPDLHWSGKTVLMVLMWLGRLEIVPAFVVFSTIFSVIARLRAGTRKAGS